MYSAAPALLPIFRSDAQARILAWLLLEPDREQAISTLVAVSGVAQPNTLREVNRLVAAGLLSERRAGNARMVRANPESPYFQPLVALLSRSFGPASVVPAVLSDVSGIEQVIVIGSWAERYLGIPGAPPRDVDVVVVGSPERRSVRAANALLEERLGQQVDLVVVSPEEWAANGTGFVKTAKSRPHATLVDRRATE